ncbi:hypothetical protein LVB87_07245 [Lysobacter sp. KIS68-7]|uniref:hypothetical protein n=1 Tax=Lysobacter sp. KIS68-7 TaxID=2904252 RepID=UPI001E381C9F|nr:hypothetical protein [Lysobacter sp. KIS68-7]UHQ20922.1 hypothetical protein LVB87_07245 [Lysobacter sp. KIS68-7]
MARRDAAQDEDFSLILGGPLYQLYLRTRMAQPPLRLLRRRMIVLAALLWLPMFALAVYEGVAWSGTALPFLNDISMYASFLVAVPLLVLAEPTVHIGLRTIARNFVDADLVPDNALPDFRASINGVIRLRNSAWIEVALLALVFIAGPWIWRQANASVAIDAWWMANDGSGLNTAGWWFEHISAPLLQFLLLRWYYRIGLWWYWLWRVSRLPLTLRATHPDRAGGIGFLTTSVASFVLVLLAQGAVVAGKIAREVLRGAATLNDHVPAMVVMGALLVLAVVGPLFFFSPSMVQARRLELQRFGALAADYVMVFERRWLARRNADKDPELLGSADFSGLADIGGSMGAVTDMRPVPLDRRTLVMLVIAVAAPFAPLVFTVASFRELLSKVLGMLL